MRTDRLLTVCLLGGECIQRGMHPCCSGRCIQGGVHPGGSSGGGATSMLHPVGCIPAAAGGCIQGGGASMLQQGVHPGCTLPPLPVNLVNRMTHAWENITFPDSLLYAVGNELHQYDIVSLLLLLLLIGEVFVPQWKIKWKISNPQIPTDKLKHHSWHMVNIIYFILWCRCLCKCCSTSACLAIPRFHGKEGCVLQIYHKYQSKEK